MSERRRLAKLAKRIVLIAAVAGLLVLGERFQRDGKNHAYAATGGLPQIKTVFMILMENHEWREMTATAAPYIRNTLVPMGAHAENYHNAPGGYPHSLPNYLLLEAGDDFGVRDNQIPPVAATRAVTNHLVTLLNRKTPPISWKAYVQGIPGNNCPLQEIPATKYVPWHEPMIYFDDVTDNNSANSQFCIDHYKPYTQLAADLRTNNVARYNFIGPDLCNDMHDVCPPTNNSIKQGDDWLSGEVPKILESQAYKDGGALFITWDEPGPPNGTEAIGMIALSPFAKVGFQNATAYTHLSTLKTLADIFEVDAQALGRAATATNLADFFTIPAASDFTITGPSSGVTVTAGQPAGFSIRVAPQGGSTFANGVTFAATGMPAATNASFNPPSITAGSGGSNTTLTITTTARSWILPPSPPNLKRSPWWFGLLAGCLAALGVWACSARKLWRPARWGLALATLLMVFHLAGCGGATSNNQPPPPPRGGTPSGTYQITVTATSGMVSHTTNVTLMVN